jgi:hypothetical protein
MRCEFPKLADAGSSPAARPIGPIAQPGQSARFLPGQRGFESRGWRCGGSNGLEWMN